MDTSRYLIYGLIDPFTQELRYIGQSSQGMRRPLSHSAPSRLKNSKTHVVCWIKGLINRGREPEIIILESWLQLTKKELDEAEVFYIGYFKSIGADLCNHTMGGGGQVGVKQSPETIAKRFESRAGYHPSAETREKMSKAQKLIARSDTLAVDILRQYAAARIGTKQSSELIEKRMASRKGYVHSQETKDKISKSHVGIGHSEETKRKISNLQKGIKRPLGWGAQRAAAIKKPIVDSLGNVFPSSKGVAEHYSVSTSTIISILKGRVRKSNKLKGIQLSYGKK